MTLKSPQFVEYILANIISDLYKGMAPTRIAILSCDPLLEPIRKTYGSYGGVIISFLQAGATRIDLPLNELEFSVWNVEAQQTYPALNEVDSIVITGSSTYCRSRKGLQLLMQHLGLSAFDIIDWIEHLVCYIKRALAYDNVKIIGLCFGHQIVGRALGAEGAVNSLGYEMSVCKVDLTTTGARMFGKEQLVSSILLEWELYSFPLSPFARKIVI